MMLKFVLTVMPQINGPKTSYVGTVSIVLDPVLFPGHSVGVGVWLVNIESRKWFCSNTNASDHRCPNYLTWVQCLWQWLLCCCLVLVFVSVCDVSVCSPEWRRGRGRGPVFLCRPRRVGQQIHLQRVGGVGGVSPGPHTTDGGDALLVRHGCMLAGSTETHNTFFSVVVIVYVCGSCNVVWQGGFKIA